ncbi:MAG TPA: NTP transferase domain-containing protein [Candidatus Eisenbacteria bacterium]|jgi:CTP:molybdopterin cytidylyltransferase MocA
MKVGVLLAAGASSRMGRSKPLARAAGQSFLARGVRHLWAACDAVVVVLGSAAPAVRRAAEGEFERLVRSGRLRNDLKSTRGHAPTMGLEVRFVVHRQWRRGMLSSVRAGLEEALGLRPESILVLPVDQPALRMATVRTLADAMQAALGAYGNRSVRRPQFAYALIPRYRRRRGHPIALSPALARSIARDPRATDLGDAVRRNTRLIGYLDVADAGVIQNRNRA